MLAWALVPWLNLTVVPAFEALGRTARTDHSTEVMDRAAVSFAILLSLWGTTRISRARPAR